MVAASQKLEYRSRSWDLILSGVGLFLSTFLDSNAVVEYSYILSGTASTAPDTKKFTTGWCGSGMKIEPTLSSASTSARTRPRRMRRPITSPASKSLQRWPIIWLSMFQGEINLALSGFRWMLIGEENASCIDQPLNGQFCFYFCSEMNCTIWPIRRTLFCRHPWQKRFLSLQA